MKNILPKSALISVSDKKNLKMLVDFLIAKEVKIISTGGTFKRIKEIRRCDHSFCKSQTIKKS